MKVLSFLTIVIVFTANTFAADISKYEKCYSERSSIIPSIEERSFLDSYIKYLKYGSKENGEIAIEKMRILARKQGGKFNIKWVSLFEGSMELCCGKPHCKESLGAATLKALYPRVEKGWATAISLVQMYQRLAKTDGADASGLNDYMRLINENHKWAISFFEKKYPDN